jgi:hypothetical protein
MTTVLPIETFRPFTGSLSDCVYASTFDYDSNVEVQMVRSTDNAVHLIGSGQDIIYTKHRVFEDREEWDIAVWDGHGSDGTGINPVTGKYEKFNITVSVLQELITNGEMEQILQKDIYDKEDPALTIQHLLADRCVKYDRAIKSGATMSLVQIRRNFTDRKITVHTLAVGDSPITIYCNREKVFETTPHDSNNADEIERLCKRNRSVHLSDASSFEILDESRGFICSSPSKYIVVNGIELAMTQSIGHFDYGNAYTAFRKEVLQRDGVYGIAPEKRTFIFDDTDEINIKAYSDGVGDVLNEALHLDTKIKKTENATQTANFALGRWRQKWNVVDKEDYLGALATGDLCVIANISAKPFYFGRGVDDICCVSWMQSSQF